MKYQKIRSGTICKCLWCGRIDYCYGQPTSAGITAPFCNQCGSQKIEPVKGM